MNPLPSLQAEELRLRCDTDSYDFETTEDLEDLAEPPGQERALEALRFGVAMRRANYNIFALGPTGLGKHSRVKELLEARAEDEPIPPDWCYVYNFSKPQNPRALQLPAGRGAGLRDDMEHLVEELTASLPAAMESEDFRTRREAIEEEAGREQKEAFEDLQEDAEARGIALIRTPAGMALAPTRDGEPLKNEEFEELTEEEQERIRADIKELEGRLEEIFRRIPEIASNARQQVRTLVREVTSFSVGHLIDDLRDRYQDLEGVLDWLDEVQEDVIDHAGQFLQSAHEEDESQADALRRRMSAGDVEVSGLRRYEVNLLVDNSEASGAPVVYEDHPSHQNLLGRIEHISQMGALITNFTLIKPGALHRANGGYLVLDVRRLLSQPFAWEELKRTLRAERIRIESVGQMLSLVSTVSLEPEPVPLNVKIVLVGERLLYYLISELDKDFRELFKVPADFSEDLDRNEETSATYARLLATLARGNDLRPLDRGAVGRVIELSARLAEDAQKLTLHERAICDLLRESDYQARIDDSDVITADHVRRARDAQIHRADRVRERIYEQIRRGVLQVEVRGETVGQINALAVAQLGDFRFARPNRVTARTRLGDGKVVDIEREVELGGPIHSKGVLILQGLLGARYATEYPLALAASIVFEQSYGGVDGDSASAAELLALLSSLADVPLRQSLAITGSINQRGAVQAIGGVNEKIEGFFDVCRELGDLDGQGVVIPRSNVQHLMLRDDVVSAVAEERFGVWAVDDLDQAIELMTGLEAGDRGDDGRYPEGTFNARVEERLEALARAARQFRRAGEHGGER
ncbi:MAG: Lon protease family protein [Myxococcota bacterium]